MREQLVQTGEATQEQTGKNLALREQALVPQEQEYRQHLLDLSTKESEIIKDATELSALRNELLKNAEDQKTKQATLNALKDSLKQIQTDLLKKETDLTGKS